MSSFSLLRSTMVFAVLWKARPLCRNGWIKQIARSLSGLEQAKRERD
jgi:hypothetical protein